MGPTAGFVEVGEDETEDGDMTESDEEKMDEDSTGDATTVWSIFFTHLVSFTDLLRAGLCFLTIVIKIIISAVTENWNRKPRFFQNRGERKPRYFWS